MILRILASVCLLVSTAAIAAGGGESALTADNIMAKVDAVDDGDNQISDIKMVLIDKHGKKRVRDIRAFRKYINDDEYNISFFTSPADIKGSGFLTIDYGELGKDDDQWLYLPALSRTKRIPSSEQSSAFMGSDFNYSDMNDSNLEDYHHKLKGDSSVNGAPVWVIESQPINRAIAKNTGYKRTVSFVRKDNYIIIRAIRFTEKGNKFKYFEVKKLEKIDGILTPSIIEMTTRQGKVFLHKTVFYFNNIKYNQNLDNNLFSVRQIENGL